MGRNRNWISAMELQDVSWYRRGYSALADGGYRHFSRWIYSVDTLSCSPEGSGSYKLVSAFEQGWVYRDMEYPRES